MRRHWTGGLPLAAVVGLSVLTGPGVIVGAQQAAAPAAATAPAPAPDPKRMEAILQAWSERSKAVKTLGVRFSREDVIHTWDEKTRYDGTAYLSSPDKAYLKFDKYGEDGQLQPSEQIICNGERVYHFINNTKQVSIYPLVEEEKQRTMEEGPLPFLFNMNADKARQRYAMTLVQENDQAYLISITPIQKADQESFSRAFVFLDKVGLKPSKIVLVDPNNKKDTKTFEIKGIEENLKIHEGWFDADGWVRKVVQAPAKPEDRWDVVVFDPSGQPISSESREGAPRPAAAPATGAGAAQPPRR